MADEATPTPAGSTTISEGSSCFFEEEFVLMGVIFLCDAKSLGKLRMTKKDLSAGLLTDPKTFKWISSLKGFPLQLLSSSQKSEVSLAERLRIAETLATLENSIHFAWGSATIRDSSYPALYDFACLLNDHPAIHASIEGHCGIEAPPMHAHHMTLSRARAVADVLELKGVDLERLSAIGHGFEQPLTLEVGPPGEKNRRVEIFLKIGDAEVPKQRSES